MHGPRGEGGCAVPVSRTQGGGDESQQRATLGFELATSASALDLTWLPADPEGPLPLSQRFRDSLERLCVIVEGDGPKPPELIMKEAHVRTLCDFLQKQ